MHRRRALILALIMTPEEFAIFIRAEQAKWQPVVAAAGVRLD